MAAPAFDDPNSSRVAGASVTPASDMSNIYFGPLPSTSQEARTLHALFPDATVLTGTKATESALKRQAAPLMLHIATHGFFLDGRQTRRQTQMSGVRSISNRAQIENPLLRSGLAFAGANQRGRAGDDGILTAMEASGLNLWGTKLVTLSACDTGLGEVRNGEGVYGLRRSFVLAGAETIVMSLWAVSDLATRDLMTGYYTGLKQGLERGEALRQIQLRMLKRADRRHPFYWASFIQTGNWKRLNE